MFCIFHITDDPDIVFKILKLEVKLNIMKLKLISKAVLLVLQQCLFQAHLNWRDGIIS